MLHLLEQLLSSFIALAAANQITISQMPETIIKDKPFDLKVEVSNLSPNIDYSYKVGIGLDTSSLGYGRVFSEETGNWISYNSSWANCPTFKTDSVGNWTGEIQAKVSDTAQIGQGFLRFRIQDNLGSSMNSELYSLTISEAVGETSEETTKEEKLPVCNHLISLSEFLANPESDNQEWVEIKNNNQESVSLTSWQVDDIEGGSYPRNFDALDIPPQGYYVVYLTTNKLNNYGDSVRLICPTGEVVDSFSYDSAQLGYSWAKDSSAGWQETSILTPGSENQFSSDTEEYTLPDSERDSILSLAAGESDQGISATDEEGSDQEGDILPEAAKDKKAVEKPEVYLLDASSSGISSEVQVLSSSYSATTSARRNGVYKYGLAFLPFAGIGAYGWLKYRRG